MIVIASPKGVAILNEIPRFALDHLVQGFARNDSFAAMQGFQSLGKLLIIVGFFIITIGLIFFLGGKIPWIGRLPGDIVIERKDFSLYIPITTSIILSIILTLIFWIFSKR